MNTRRFGIRGEKSDPIAHASILFGGVLSVLSGRLVWAKADPSTLGAGLPALFVNEAALMRRGFELRIGWLSVGWCVAACGIAAAALLLWGGNSTWVPKVQMSLGAVILLIALFHLSTFPGVLAAAAGGAFIVAGACLATFRTERDK